MGSKPSSDVKTPIMSEGASDELPLKAIPGSYGMPIFGALKDRLDFFWFQGQNKFWTYRMQKYGSTVFRVNVAPGPPGFRTSRVVMLLDQKSFPILFDVSKVEKKDVLLANYMPSLALFGGTRPCIFLDPSEERHTKIKSFIMHLIKLNASKWIPEMEKAAAEVFAKWDGEIEGGKATVNTETSQVACNVLIRTIVGRDPAAPGEGSLGTKGPSLFQTWLAPLLAPIASLGLPHLLEELTFHAFRIPAFVVSPTYKKLTKFFETYGTELLDMAERDYSIDRNEALHNIIFFMGFNAFGGFSIFFPTMVGHIGSAGRKLHNALMQEVRDAVQEEDGGRRLTVGALRKMELVRSTVYECLRMSPPVAYQYATAKEDMIIESHDARFEVKKGEILGGCQPIATRDPRIFKDAETFVAERFMGEEGKKLIKYVIWGNGPADGHTSATNKQCAANDLVPLLSQAFLACLFLHYDSFTTFKPTVKGNSITIQFSSLHKAT